MYIIVLSYILICAQKITLADIAFVAQLSKQCTCFSQAYEDLHVYLLNISHSVFPV